ncbi:MAG: SGNH/GDSL hydrolase family protein [Rhizobiaceae bacterium]
MTMRLRRTASIFIAAILIAALGVPVSGPTTGLLGYVAVDIAAAQSAKPKKRRSLFNLLFGRRSAKKKAVVKKSRKKRSRKSRSAGGSAAPVVKGVEKNPDARVVLVVGDFFAGGLADGLTTALAQSATIRVVDKSKGLSGFVRSDIVDWSQELPNLIAETKPSYIVAMLGSNDRQLMREDGKRLKKETPEWLAAYTKRVEGLGQVLQSSGINYAWIGLPPVRFKTMNKDFLVFNEIYKKAATSFTGRFFDVWDGFSDADGNYSRSGPDVNGQIVLLRSKDGINLTRAGKRRLSYYVESTVNKLLGGAAGESGLAGVGFDLDTVPLASPQYDPAKTGRTVIVRLDDPKADGGDQLAGETVEFPSSPVGQPVVATDASFSTPIPTAVSASLSAADAAAASAETAAAISALGLPATSASTRPAKSQATANRAAAVNGSKATRTNRVDNFAWQPEEATTVPLQ